MATKPMAKPAVKKAAPVRGARTATHMAKATPAPGMMSDKQWQAKEDMHHLKRAAEIQADPARHKAAKAEAAAQMKALASVVKK